MIANSVNRRVFTVRPWSVSAIRTRPNAPSMSPRCAVSSTADGRDATVLGAGGGPPPAGVGSWPGPGFAPAVSGSVTTRSVLCGQCRRGGTVGVADWARGRFAPPPIVGDGGLKNVINGDHTKDAVVVVDDRSGDQVVVSH